MSMINLEADGNTYLINAEQVCFAAFTRTDSKEHPHRVVLHMTSQTKLSVNLSSTAMLSLADGLTRAWAQ